MKIKSIDSFYIIYLLHLITLLSLNNRYRINSRCNTPDKVLRVIIHTLKPGLYFASTNTGIQLKSL